tara:strand:+ start:136 stop:423 length:288 start_codon:yes stop_codon:yes gene_type:complete
MELTRDGSYEFDAVRDKSNRRCSTCGWRSIVKFEIGAICSFCHVELGFDDDLLGDFHDNPSTDNAKALVIFYQGLAETWQTFVEDREEIEQREKM